MNDNIIVDNSSSGSSSIEDQSCPNLTQRVVSHNLGKNIIKDHELIYSEIEKRLGPTKKCRFGHIKGSSTGIKHEGCEDVSVRNFETKGVCIKNQIVTFNNRGDGLQGFCRDCSKRRRKARLDKEKNEKCNKTDDEIHLLYKTKYGIETKKCSRCKENKELVGFNVSFGMECGLHNVCKLCSSEYGSSVGDRWIIYMPDGNYKYTKTEKDTHDDHIFPLSLGGSNFEPNHQLLSSSENLQKSNDISQFSNIQNINPILLSERYRAALTTSTTIAELKILLNQLIYDDILQRSLLSDEELIILYDTYCRKYNLRRDITRAVKKFRDYCKLRDI